MHFDATICSRAEAKRLHILASAHISLVVLRSLDEERKTTRAADVPHEVRRAMDWVYGLLLGTFKKLQG